MTGESILRGTAATGGPDPRRGRIAFRAPVFFGEAVTVETRATRIGRTSLGARAPADRGPGGGPPASWHDPERPRPLRLRDGAPVPVAARISSPGSRRSRAAAPRLSRRRLAGRSASSRRKIVTAFCPPNPKPWTATVSTFAFARGRAARSRGRTPDRACGGSPSAGSPGRGSRRSPASARRDPGRADEVADHRLRRADRDLVRVLPVGRLDRPRLGHVVERRGRAVGDDVVDLVGRDARCCGGRSSSPGSGRGRSAPGR